MNSVYQWVAMQLNHFENHRTDQEFENALIAKTFIFQFINSYIALFFIAFLKSSPIPNWATKYDDGTNIPHSDLPLEFRTTGKVGGYSIGTCNQVSCMLDLFFQLAVIVIVKQLLSNFAEIGVPWLMGKFTFLRKISEAAKKKKKEMQRQALAGTSPAVVDTKELDDEIMERMPFFEEQVTLAKFGGTFYEYNELLIQFGYMSMFATSFPLASVFSLINNTLEIRVDASKILFATQRPPYEGACDIGTWLSVLEVINLLAVMTNTAIICFTSTALRGEWVDRTTQSYRDCATACSPVFANITTSWATAQTFSNKDAWIYIGNASDYVKDANSCLFHCACSGRCMGYGDRFLVFVVTEHILIFLKMALDYYIPDVPKDIARSMVWKELVQETIKLAAEKEKRGVINFDDWNTDNDSGDEHDVFDAEEEEPATKVKVIANPFTGKVRTTIGGVEQDPSVAFRSNSVSAPGPSTAVASATVV